MIHGKESNRPPAPTKALTGSDRKSTRRNSSHGSISYAVFCLKKKKKHEKTISCSDGIEAQMYFTTSIRTVNKAPFWYRRTRRYTSIQRSDTAQHQQQTDYQK